MVCSYVRSGWGLGVTNPQVLGLDSLHVNGGLLPLGWEPVAASSEGVKVACSGVRVGWTVRLEGVLVFWVQ